MPAISRATIVVPARDEQDLLPQCLDALDAAIAQVTVPVQIVVVLDSCRDRTAEIVRERPWVVAIELEAGNVGRARAAGVIAGLRAESSTPPDEWWLATTDADSCVPRDWLTSQIALAADGWEVMVGTVQVVDWSDHPDHVERRWSSLYHSAERHPHVHGANLGMTLAAYLDAGGFPLLATSEDVALVAALAGRRIVRTAAQPVITSARCSPRATGGFGDHLRELAG